MPRMATTVGTVNEHEATALALAQAPGTTRSRLVALRTEFPQMTASQLARLLKVSRERVRQLLVMERLPTTVRGERRGAWQRRRGRRPRRARVTAVGES